MNLNFLRNSRIDNIDGNDRIEEHRKIINNKPFLKSVYTDIHKDLMKLNRKFSISIGNEIEIGSGIYPMKNTFEGILASDVISSPYIDLVINAEDMNIEKNSVAVFFGQNFFHHLSDPTKFFMEIDNNLSVGGVVVLMEPYYSFFAKFLFKKLFATEGFNMSQTGWITENSSVMSNANQALSYVVLVRDRKILEDRFPNLKVVYQNPSNIFLRYLFSGGLNFKQLMPYSLFPLIRLLDLLFTPFNRFIGIFHYIVIKKIS